MNTAALPFHSANGILCAFVLFLDFAVRKGDEIRYFSVI
jgi:hypothetical protein